MKEDRDPNLLKLPDLGGGGPGEPEETGRPPPLPLTSKSKVELSVEGGNGKRLSASKDLLLVCGE